MHNPTNPQTKPQPKPHPHTPTHLPHITLLALLLLTTTQHTYAPLIYTPGEGWHYETPGQAAQWQRQTALEQLQHAQQTLNQKDYKTTIKSAGRILRQWPQSDYTPQARHLIARAHQHNRRYEKAFKTYQTLLDQHPQYPQYNQILQQQLHIANRFLHGQRFRLWGTIPLFRSMEKTAQLYRDILKNGPYSPVAPQAQLNIGAALEKKKNYPAAHQAYQTAADKYHNQKNIAADALYLAAQTLLKETKTAEYDQSIATRAIQTLDDFTTLHPQDPRTQQAQKQIRQLRIEQARGSLQTARFYDKKNNPQGALIYYNDVIDIFSRLLSETQHPYANQARQRIAQIKNQTNQPQQQPTNNNNQQPTTNH